MKMFRAVVEYNNDGEKLGRVKVRIHGLHTKNNENSSEFSAVKTTDLPWAEVMGGNQFGLISGVGVSSVLRQGTWVWVILENDNPNKPIVIGTIIGKSTVKTEYSSGEGFNDPDGIYPKDDRLGSSDINPLTQNKYLTLAVLETESGHIIELDDTVGDERVKVTHKIGSFITMEPDGSIKVSNSNENGSITINEDGTMSVTSSLVTFTGNVHTVGDVTTDAGVSLNSHTHPGDGGDNSVSSTGAPDLV
jgi:hypothetical protein